MANVDRNVVDGFGKEWSKFDQRKANPADLELVFQSYFAIFPWQDLQSQAEGFDLGCGSGRWAYFVAPRVKRLHCIDPSMAALNVAQQHLKQYKNCDFHCASVESIPLPDSSADFGYSLGVLHAVPDPQQGLAQCARKLKPGAPFLLYLYYAFDNRPWWFRTLWRGSDIFRRLISKLPFSLKSLLCELIAAFVYWPLARLSYLLERVGFNVQHFPLAAYSNRSFYIMRNDALDRFGTRLEKRFTREQIRDMMQNAGLERITFGDSPYWCALGYRRNPLG
jgi:ubiquinone/menaquinone biosynthesis C-methylase UbiE